MRHSAPFSLPDDKRDVLLRARRAEWWSIAFLVSTTVLMILAAGSSQAMRAAWLEDVLSLIPPISFLITSRVAHRAPTHRFAFGFGRATTIGYLCGSLALAGMGGYLLVESVTKLVSAEMPTIGSVQLMGRSIWQGWVMLPVLLWSTMPPIFLGRYKEKLAKELHDKSLHADALMNKADWMTAGAAAIGVCGTAMGFWWADAAAASLIAFDVTRDGWKNLRISVGDLMDRKPLKVDGSEPSSFPEKLKAHLQAEPWVREVSVRVREEGHHYFADAVFVPEGERVEPAVLESASRRAKELDWRLHELLLMPVTKLPEQK